MQPETSAPKWRGGIFAGLVTVAALAGPAWPYVNGGDFHNTFLSYAKKLKAQGWGVSHGTSVPEDGDRTKLVAQDVKVTPADNAKYQGYINQLVARALKALPEKSADQLSARARRAVTRLTREAIRAAVLNQRQVITKGRSGAVEYQVGVFRYEQWWETNYGGKRKIHEKRAGLVPFVALKVVAGKTRR
jgi:hypothetical protein